MDQTPILDQRAAFRACRVGRYGKQSGVRWGDHDKGLWPVGEHQKPARAQAPIAQTPPCGKACDPGCDGQRALQREADTETDLPLLQHRHVGKSEARRCRVDINRVLLRSRCKFCVVEGLSATRHFAGWNNSQAVRQHPE